MNGWVSIYRKLATSNLWLKQKFTKGQAWVDLIILANHKDSVIEKRGNQITIKRGQVGWSELALSIRWKWSRNKTTRFLKWLENEKQIIQQRTRITTIITIVNYEDYQNPKNKMKQQKIQQKDNRSSKTIQQKDTNNNDNNINNENNTRNTTARSDKSLQAKAIINFTFETNKWENITSEDIDIWKEAYPACDINLGLKQIRSWLIANPKKKKKNYRRFITNWLSRWQEKGGSTKSEKYEEDASEKYRTV